MIVGLHLIFLCSEGWCWPGSLKGKPHETFRSFFNGKVKEEDDLWSEVGSWQDNRLPEGFWSFGNAKKAARALIEFNRSEAHKKTYRLMFKDDREIPKSGWLQFELGSAGCYSYSSRSLALRYGNGETAMFVVESNSLGAVGRNPWADQSAYQVFEVPIGIGESLFVAEVVFWISQLEVKEVDEDRLVFGGGMYSSADGFSWTNFYEKGAKARQVAMGTTWTTGSIKTRWVGSFPDDDDAKMNLIELVLREGLEHRWSRPEKLDPHSLVTPTEVRVGERVAEAQRDESGRTISKVFKMDRKERLPAAFLQRLVRITGELGLSGQLEELERLEKTVTPEPGEEERELINLKKKPIIPGDFLSEPPAWEKRLTELKDKFEFDRSHLLRDSLRLAKRQLVLRDNEDLLAVEVAERGELSRWAMERLLRSYPDAWLAEMHQQFRDAVTKEARETIFETVAVVDAVSARVLISTMGKEIYEELLLTITEFRLRQEPTKAASGFAELVDFYDNKRLGHHDRIQVLMLMSKLDLGDEASQRRKAMIIEEIRHPRSRTTNSLSEEPRFEAFLNLPRDSGDLELLWSLPSFLKLSPDLGIRLLQSTIQDSKEEKMQIERFIGRQLAGKSAEIDDLAEICLALDLRNLAPQLRKLATEGPGEVEGERRHLARVVCAFWREDDEETRAKMWIDLLVANRYSAGNAYFPNALLNEKAKKAIAGLTPELRGLWIEEAIGYFDDFRHLKEKAAWLRSLK